MVEGLDPIPSGAFAPGEAFSALIFDCDGTLVDTAPAHLAAYNEALRGVGLQIAEDWYLPRFGLTPQATLAELATLHGVHLDVDETLARYAESFQGGLHRLREIPVVAGIARAHRGRVPMAVASNGTRANVALSLEAVGLGPVGDGGLFDALVAVDDVAHGKPAPDLYLEAARRLGVVPADCIVFEDTEPGFAAARAAGMRVRDVRTLVR